MLTHKKRAQRSSRRRSRMALAADAHPPSVTSTQPFWPAGFLSSCGQLLPLPRVSRPACVPHHVYVLVRLPAVHGFEVHGCCSNDYAHSGSENMTGSAYYGWPNKKIPPPNVRRVDSKSICFPTLCACGFVDHSRSRFSSTMRNFWTVSRISLESRQMSHLFDGGG